MVLWRKIQIARRNLAYCIRKPYFHTFNTAPNLLTRFIFLLESPFFHNWNSHQWEAERISSFLFLCCFPFIIGFLITCGRKNWMNEWMDEWKHMSGGISFKVIWIFEGVQLRRKNVKQKKCRAKNLLQNDVKLSFNSWNIKVELLTFVVFISYVFLRAFVGHMYDNSSERNLCT